MRVLKSGFSFPHKKRGKVGELYLTRHRGSRAIREETGEVRTQNSEVRNAAPEKDLSLLTSQFGTFVRQNSTRSCCEWTFNLRKIDLR